MLEVSKEVTYKEDFYESDWEMVSDLPEWAQAYAEKYPGPVCQAAMYRHQSPADAVKPELIEVYSNNLADAVLVIYKGDVISGDYEELCKPQQAIAIEFDSVVRYVEIEGRDLLNTVGRMILPDCFVSATSQAEMLLKLAIT